MNIYKINQLNHAAANNSNEEQILNNTNLLQANIINILADQAEFKSTNIYSSLLNNKNLIYENSNILAENFNCINDERSGVLNRLINTLSPRSTRRHRQLLLDTDSNINDNLKHLTNRVQQKLKKTYSSLSLQVSTASTSSNSSTMFKFIFKSHKFHLIAFFMLIVTCLTSLFIFYDYLCLYQLTSDSILLYTIMLKFIYLCWYLIVWLVLSFKLEWEFQLTQMFKLNMWHNLNRLFMISNYKSYFSDTNNNNNLKFKKQNNETSNSNESNPNNANEYSNASQTASTTNLNNLETNQYYLNEEVLNSKHNKNHGLYSFKNRLVKHSISSPSVSNITTNMNGPLKSNMFPTDLYTTNENDAEENFEHLHETIQNEQDIDQENLIKKQNQNELNSNEQSKKSFILLSTSFVVVVVFLGIQYL